MDEQVTLTAYADQVRELIRNDRNDEAVAICKHILRYYPKYVDAYRQLGQALLEKGQLDDAKEVFRRVLSADPESVVAYAGLAVILEQEHLVAEAAWHMERAYELAPGNTELHKELHRLYHELDGRPRARLKLTPGALARLYVQEGFFAQAIQELNAIVAESAARFDRAGRAGGNLVAHRTDAPSRRNRASPARLAAVLPQSEFDPGHRLERDRLVQKASNIFSAPNRSIRRIKWRNDCSARAHPCRSPKRACRATSRVRRWNPHRSPSRARWLNRRRAPGVHRRRTGARTGTIIGASAQTAGAGYNSATVAAYAVAGNS